MLEINFTALKFKYFGKVFLQAYTRQWRDWGCFWLRRCFWKAVTEHM